MERIAFLVKYGWSKPIEVDVGVPGYDRGASWIIQDGNHRLAAADYRRDPHIAVEVSGSQHRALDWLQIQAEEPSLPYSTDEMTDMGYEAWRLLSNGEMAAVGRMAFNNGRLYAGIQTHGYEDCGCFDSYEKAWQALWNWDTSLMTEPTGWKRHPFTGRRRENGDPATEYVSN